MFWNTKVLVAQHEMRINQHERDCREDRERTKLQFDSVIGSIGKVDEKIDRRHAENRASVRGIYALLWSVAGGIVLLLISALAFLLKTVMHL